MRIFGCSKFKKLASDALDRTLTPAEEAFVQKHRMVCTDCDAFEDQSFMAMNFLRSATIDVEVHPQFEERVIRKLRIQTTRESLRYWSPALAGAFIAGLAVVAALQIITRSAELPHVKFLGGEARLVPHSRTNPLDQNINPPLVR